MNLSKESTGNNQSVIQIIGNIISAKNKFFNELNTLTEQFKIKDNIFGFNGNNCDELKEGYFGQSKGYQNLNDMYDDFNVLEDCIRVKENVYYIGKWFGRLEDAKGDIIIDLKNSKVLNY